MNYLIKVLLIAGLSANTFLAHSDEITDTYSNGDTLTANTLNNIKSAVNDNDIRVTTNSAGVTTNALGVTTNAAGVDTNATAITANAAGVATNETAITTNAASISANGVEIDANASDISDLQDTISSTTGDVDSSVTYQIPVLSTTSANTTVSIWLANESTTTCDARLASKIDAWRVGSNSKGGLILLPFYADINLPGKTISGVFPNIFTNTTIISYSNMNANVSASNYVDVTLFRAETAATDTCNAGDVSVRGAMVTYPGGLQYFVPLKEMIVQ